MRRMLVASIFPIFAGCAINVPYVAPTEGPAAVVQYKNNAQRKLEISYFEVSNGCQRRRRTDIILPGMEATHRIYANRDITFQYYLTNTTGKGSEEYCIANLRFLPVVNHEYTFVTSEDAGKCKWAMVDSTDKPKMVPVELKVKEWKRGMDENSSFCDE